MSKVDCKQIFTHFCRTNSLYVYLVTSMISDNNGWYMVDIIASSRTHTSYMTVDYWLLPYNFDERENTYDCERT